MTAYTEKQYVEEMIATRRKIHQTPEEGWTEFQTTWLVAERLRALGLKVLLGTQVINPKAVMGRDPKLVEAAIEDTGLPICIHRLFARLDAIQDANCVVAVAGMEGALASVLGE